MKIFLRKHWPLAGIALLLVVVSFYLFRFQGYLAQRPMIPDVSSEEGFRLQDIHYSQDDPDKGIKWELDAEEAKVSKDRRLISFRHFRLKLEPEKKPYIEIRGLRGSYDKGSGEINLRENLQGITGNGFSIVTEHVLYQQKEGYLKTVEPVKITGPSFSVEGEGLYVDLEKERLTIGAKVTTVIDREALQL